MLEFGDYTMTASRLKRPIKAVRSIVRDMANMKDMRDLVALIKKANDKNWKETKEDLDEQPYGSVNEYTLHVSWIPKEEAIDKFSSTIGGDEQKARDIYGDATSSRYKYLREDTPDGSTKRVDVTSDGRGLIKRRVWRKVPTGLLRERTEKLWPVTGPVTTIILCLAAIANAVIAYYIHKHG